MINTAKGEFEVKLVPQQDERSLALLARMTIDKVFHGDITGTSQGQMLSAGTAIPNSAGYVAIERVEGTLDGKKGTFVLQHHATMNKGESSLNIIVVPDSGTEQLTGLSGTFVITMKEKKHFYQFDYMLPE